MHATPCRASFTITVFPNGLDFSSPCIFILSASWEGRFYWCACKKFKRFEWMSWKSLDIFKGTLDDRPLNGNRLGAVPCTCCSRRCLRWWSPLTSSCAKGPWRQRSVVVTICYLSKYCFRWNPFLLARSDTDFCICRSVHFQCLRSWWLCYRTPCPITSRHWFPASRRPSM